MSNRKWIVAGIGTLVLALGLNASADLKEITDCRGNTSDIREAAAFVDSNWVSFERAVERDAGVNIKGCMENRFKDNGKIVCELSGGGNCSGANGWASYLSHTAHFCPLFTNNLATLPREADRKACNIALMAHEFSHTCWRSHGTTEDIDDAAFAWAKAQLGATIDLINCGMD